MQTDPGTIKIAHRHMNVEIGAEATLFPEKEYISGIFVAVRCWQPQKVAVGAYGCILLLEVWVGSWRNLENNALSSLHKWFTEPATEGGGGSNPPGHTHSHCISLVGSVTIDAKTTVYCSPGSSMGRMLLELLEVWVGGCWMSMCASVVGTFGKVQQKLVQLAVRIWVGCMLGSW